MLKKPLRVCCLHTLNIISLLGLFIVWNLTDTSILFDLPAVLISGNADSLSYSETIPVISLLIGVMLGILLKGWVECAFLTVGCVFLFGSILEIGFPYAIGAFVICFLAFTFVALLKYTAPQLMFYEFQRNI